MVNLFVTPQLGHFFYIKGESYRLKEMRRAGRCTKFGIALPFLLSSASCDMISDLSPTNALAIEVTGDEFNWYFRYPGRDGLLGTDDDQHSVQNLFLPENTDIVLKLTSNDHLYSFALPDLDLREVAVPGLSFELQFRTKKSNQTLQILGDQFCGFAHETLVGKVHVGIEGDNPY